MTRSRSTRLGTANTRERGLHAANSDSQLKISCDIAFVNSVEVLLGKSISLPPQDPELVYASMANRLKDRLVRVIRRILGDRVDTLDIETAVSADEMESKPGLAI